MSKIELDREEKEILKGFVAEGREMLDNAEPLLIELENTSGKSSKIDPEIINTIFRLFHSLKGGAGFLNLDTVQKVTHHAETLLDMYRKGKANPCSSHIDILNKTSDFIRILLDNIDKKLTDKGHEDDAEIIVNDLLRITSSIAVNAENQNTKIIDSNPQKTVESAPSTSQNRSSQRKTNPPDELQLTITPAMTKQFITESTELLETAEEALLNLENEPDNKEYLSQAFRALHSFKGNSGFFGYSDLQQVSHQAETVLGEIRDAKESCDSKIISLLLEILDFIRGGINQISQGKNPKIIGKMGVINLLKDTLKNLNKPQTRSIPEPDKSKTTKDNIVNRKAEEHRSGSDRRSGDDRRRSGRRMSDLTTHRQSVRVDVEKLDSLLDIVSELVIAEAMVAQNPDLKGLHIPLDRFEKSVMQLDKITRSLQDVVTSIRMVPLSGTFRKMIRLVRDLSQKAGKHVELEIIGEETEMDKTVIELITDPLVHIIRNSIDHGLETPQGRKTAGKSPQGNVTLEAKYVGGEVWITITDDGRGLDRHKILKKASDKGIILDDGSELNDEEVWQIIFQPGISTADQITSVSGRGVGMDVVRRNIENIRGKVDIHSEKNKGTSVVLKIPLTLAIIDGMVVRVGKTRYTIPIMDIRESWQPSPDTITKLMNGQEIADFRGRLHPVIRLHDLFHIDADCKKLSDGIIIMAENDGKTTCLFADELLGQQQIVIKGLSDYIGNRDYISGCTILGDGDVSLIINVAGISKSAENKEVQTQSL